MRATPVTAKHATCTCAMDSPFERRKGKAPSRKKSKVIMHQLKKAEAQEVKLVAV